MKSLLGVLVIVLGILGSTGQNENSFQIFNAYGKKCMSFAESNNSLVLAGCTHEDGVFFNWTVDGRLKGAYSVYKNKCIQVNNNASITTSDCTLENEITWSCEGRTLKTRNWYLTWNGRLNKIEVTKTIRGREALWVLLGTDNSVCDWPARPTTTTTPTTPFVQPTKPSTERDSLQMWPQGYYSLPKAASGCPGSTNFTWKEGWVFQDLDDTGEIKTKSSKSFNMAAMIDDWGNIKRWFCTKDDATRNEETIRPLWPNGTYCIYSATKPSQPFCPRTTGTSQFWFGYGYWDNQFLMNDSDMKGVLPRGNSVPRGRTNIYFCCQDNQDANIPMSLPIDQPFYLLAFTSSTCQKVRWATVIPQFILYDTADHRNKDEFEFFTPFNATRHDPKIYYCYYEGCNHTLKYKNETESEIKFPTSQFLDMTSQSCSWTIAFPSNYTISLNVMSLDIPSKHSEHCNTQFLEISDGNVLKSKLCGIYSQYQLNSLSNSVMMVLQLNSNVTKTTGFHISFKGFLKKDSSSSPSTTAENSTSNPRTKAVKTYNTKVGSPTERNRQTAASAQQKNENSKVLTTSIVVPVVTVVVIAVAVAIAWFVRKRKKETANALVKFKNEEVVVEESSESKEPEADIAERRNNDDVEFYESVDNDLTSLKYSKNPEKNPVVKSSEEHGKCNPLYELADRPNQTDYSSADNTLYSSGN